MKAWYVVRTKSRCEDRSAWHLENQGFEVYLPHYRKQVRHARSVKSVLRPLFSGYLFVHMDLDQQRWRAINGSVGVISLVPSGDAPKPIPNEIVDHIRAREDKSGAVSLAPHGLQKGDKVHMREGALAEYAALLEEVCDEKRVILLLNLMGREVRLKTSMENLVKAS
ncbi:MAG: transcriptional activator RfaH [Rhodospirillales bacterium]|nr:transcriptional activator RfaH [Rhodospirillales bacterium]